MLSASNNKTSTGVRSAQKRLRVAKLMHIFASNRVFQNKKRVFFVFFCQFFCVHGGQEIEHFLKVLDARVKGDFWYTCGQPIGYEYIARLLIQQRRDKGLPEIELPNLSKHLLLC